MTRLWVALPLLLAGCAKPPAPPLIVAHAGDVLQAVRAPGAKVVVLNNWATWCGPCREEFPDLVKLARKCRPQGLRVVFLSWDADPAVAEKFLAAQGVDFPSYIKAADDSDPKFIDALEPRWTGAFPATMVYDEAGKVVDFWEGKRPFAVFEQKVLDVLSNAQRKGDQAK